VKRQPEALETFNRIGPDVVLGIGTVVHAFANLYGCTIGDESIIGAFVEIQKGVKIGARCKISSHSFLCEGLTIEDEVFIGHHVCFTNDRYPRAVLTSGRLLKDGDWRLEPTLVERGANIGSGTVVLPGVTIGSGATIGAGSVVTTDVEMGITVVGCPAKPMGWNAPHAR
jgi:UDP-2-acetamido-3-amino-2,3-dideoxy-glucuronate N-acetyltransferase